MSEHEPATAPQPAARYPGLGVAALVVFVAVGGLLVFGFAGALWPAVEAQNEAVCRPLTPEPRSGPAPALVAQGLDGAPFDLGSLRGKLVVLNFWATWCEPCVGEWPQLDRLAERFADRDDVVVVAVSIDKSVEEIAPFLERMSLTGTRVKVVWDPTQVVHNAFGSQKIPDTFVVGRDGSLLQAYINVRDWGRPAAYRCIAALAGG